MAIIGSLISFKLYMQELHRGKHGDTQEETILETPGAYTGRQPSIGDEYGGDEEDDQDIDVGAEAEDTVGIDDAYDEEKGLTEDELRRIQKGDSIDILSELRMKPKDLFRLHIPLIRLVAMPMVRPTLACDITKLEQEFAGGYRDGAAVFYVSITNEEGQSEEFTDVEMSNWDPIWREKNELFTRYLDSRREMKDMKNLKFFICDGNHRRLAWMNVIDRCYSSSPKWHFFVDCIVLETKERTELIMQVMHDINK